MWEAKTGKLRAGSMKQGARTGKWKAVREKADAPIELFDLSKDPGEKSNVAAANPEVVASMERVLRESHKEPRSHAEGSMQWVK